MADWTTISDTSVDPDAPLTSQLGYAWRDNPIAIAEGATGAPRIQTLALQAPTAGNTYPIARMRPVSQVGPGTVYSDPLNIAKSGDIRLTFDVTMAAGVTGTVSVHRVGSSDVVVSSAIATGAVSVDFSISRSQYIVIEITITSGASAIEVDNILFSSGTDGGFLA